MRAAIVTIRREIKDRDAPLLKVATMRPLADLMKWMTLTFSPDGLVTSISQGAENLTGYSAQELVGKPVTEILGDRSVFEISQIMDSAREWGSWDGEIVHRDRNGRSLDGRGSLCVFTGRTGNNLGYSLTTILNESVTADGACESALVEVVGKLRLFAHELNNPLAVVMGITQLVMTNTACTGKFRS